MKKYNKYGAKKVKADGYIFDSKAEYKRYQELVLLRKAGIIKGLVIHPSYTCIVNQVTIGKVILDFQYYDNKKEIIVTEDVKGKDNALSMLKRKLVKACHGVDVTIIKIGKP